MLVNYLLISGLTAGAHYTINWIIKNNPDFNPWPIPILTGIITFIIGYVFLEKARESDAVKHEFITVVAHKLRTPLTQIKWAVSALKEKEEQDKEKKELVEEIGQVNNRLTELVNQLLITSKEEENKYLLNLTSAWLEEITKKVIALSDKEIKKKDIKLTFNFEKNLPKIKVDERRIESVIQMLMDNAISYTHPTDGIIEINIKRQKNYLLFSIRDNGIGVEKSDQPYIFSKFFRTHKAYLAETEGAGLGLFLANSIIKRHKGKLEVYSEGEGKGSIFTFRLPVR